MNLINPWCSFHRCQDTKYDFIQQAHLLYLWNVKRGFKHVWHRNDFQSNTIEVQAQFKRYVCLSVTRGSICPWLVVFLGQERRLPSAGKESRSPMWSLRCSLQLKRHFPRRRMCSSTASSGLEAQFLLEPANSH